MRVNDEPDPIARVSLPAMTPARFASFRRWLEVIEVPAGTVVVREGEEARDMFFIVEGTVHVQRAGMDLGTRGRGEYFGDIGFLAWRPRAATVVASTPLTLARLSRERWEEMCRTDPSLALAFLRAVIGGLGVQLDELTDSVAFLLHERSLPRRKSIEARIIVGDAVEKRQVRTGTPLRALLPAEVDGSPVVAALLDSRAVSLHTPIAADATVAPLTAAQWDGRQIDRRSVGLLLLEAATEIAPTRTVRLGPSMGVAKRIEIADSDDLDLAEFAGALVASMKRRVRADVVFREEWWTVEEARTHFMQQGWEDAVALLAGWREATVPMASCGNLYALSFGPFVASAGILGGFDVRVRDGAGSLLLHYGDEGPLEPVASIGALGAPSRAPVSVRREDDTMMRAHELWLSRLNVTSAGAFNRACVVGEVSQIIRVAEGFHEKQIGAIADVIRQRTDASRRVRVVSVAGPSSSGKTTFIKRLSVQLQVDGINPVGISLDDYYVDREKTVRDAKGEYDYEAFEALDSMLLQQHLARLLAGEHLRTARYDFQSGRSSPDGGREIALGPRDILIIEGIHGLNPRLLADSTTRQDVFRIFIQPMTSLAFDRLSRVDPSDIRLLRRIVRDRHTRGAVAADNILRWPSVRAGERAHIFPYLGEADVVFDSSLIYELSVIKVFADRYLLEVPDEHPAYATALRLRQLVDRFVAIYPDHVPPTSIIREFIGGSGFEY